MEGADRVKRKEIKTYWSEELIKLCESMMNSEYHKEEHENTDTDQTVSEMRK